MIKGYPKNPLWRNPLQEYLPPLPFGPPHFADGGSVQPLPMSDLTRLTPIGARLKLFPIPHASLAVENVKAYAHGGEVEEPIEIEDVDQAKKDLARLEQMLENEYKSFDPSKKKQKKKIEKIKQILELIDHISEKMKQWQGDPMVGRYFHIGDEYRRVERMRKDLNPEMNADEFRKILKEGVNLRKLFRKIDEKLAEREERDIEEKAERALYKEPEKQYSHVTFTPARKRGGLIHHLNGFQPLPRSDVDRLVPMKRKGGMCV